MITQEDVEHTKRGRLLHVAEALANLEELAARDGNYMLAYLIGVAVQKAKDQVERLPAPPSEDRAS